MALKQDLYDSLPPLLQNVLLNLYAWKIHRQRYGREFEKVYQFLLQSQHYGPEQIVSYQQQRLQALIRHAYATVPYYRELFDSVGVRPEQITTARDLEKIPLLTKDDVRNNADRLVSSKFRSRDLVPGNTSGTTGSPLNVFWDQETCVYTNAVDWRQKNWAGIEPGERMALFLGRPIVSLSRTRPPFWQLDRFHNQLWMSSFHMSEANLEIYYEKLLRYRPAALEGYPSTIYIFARFLNERGLSLPVKAVFTSSETLYPLQREAAEKAFCCKLTDFYGLAERVVFATECGAHDGHHLNFEFGLTEIVDDEGRQRADGEYGMLTSTSLHNYAMPFIRYRTTDLTRVIPGVCACGRHMPRIEAISTKAEDMIVRPDGTPVSSSVLTHPFKPMKRVEKSQIIQDRPDHITIRIVAREGYSEEDSSILLKAFRERVGADIAVDIELVDDIPRTRSGKFRWVISSVGQQVPKNNV